MEHFREERMRALAEEEEQDADEEVWGGSDEEVCFIVLRDLLYL